MAEMSAKASRDVTLWRLRFLLLTVEKKRWLVNDFNHLSVTAEPDFYIV